VFFDLTVFVGMGEKSIQTQYSRMVKLTHISEVKTVVYQLFNADVAQW